MDAVKGRVGRRRSTSWEHISDVAIDLFMARGFDEVSVDDVAAAAGIATINSIGNLGGFVGPAMIGWIKERTGSFEGGLYFVAGLLVLSAVLTLLLSRAPAAAEPHPDPLRTR